MSAKSRSRRKLTREHHSRPGEHVRGTERQQLPQHINADKLERIRRIAQQRRSQGA